MEWTLKVNKTKIVIKLILIGLALAYLSSCVSPTLHESNPKLHNIQVINLTKWDDNLTIMRYYSFKDSGYHKCYINAMFLDSFKIGSIRK